MRKQDVVLKATLQEHYGFGTRNHRGDRFVQFYAEKKLAISNTFFQIPPRRLCTGTSPADYETNIIRNNIDFILVKQQMREFNFSWCRRKFGSQLVVMQLLPFFKSKTKCTDTNYR